MYTNFMNTRFLITIPSLLLALSVTPALAQVSGDILCPSPEQAAKNAPKNLSDVQADIERFNLCVERAKLLNELNNLSKKNDDDILNRNSNAPFAGTGPAASQSGGLPPLPGLSVGGSNNIDTSSIQPVDEGDIVSIQDALTPPKPRTASRQQPNWALRNVYGSSGTLNAELVSSDGDVAIVAQGDTLADGSTVKRVSALGVVITRNGKDIPVNWVE